MKAIVVGLGSMGKRRIRLLRNLYPDMQISGVDTQQGRRDEAAGKWNISVYSEVDKVEKCK